MAIPDQYLNGFPTTWMAILRQGVLHKTSLPDGNSLSSHTCSTKQANKQGTTRAKGAEEAATAQSGLDLVIFVSNLP